MTQLTRSESARHVDETGTPRTLAEYLDWLLDLSLRGVDLRPLAEGLLRDKFRLEAALEKVRNKQTLLRKKIQALTTPQRYPAVITHIHRNGERKVDVYGAGMNLQVAVGPDVADEQLRIGAQGALSAERNCLVEVYGIGPTWNEIGSFEGRLEGNQRILLRHQDELLAVMPIEELASRDLRRGDLVGFNREGARLAYAQVEPPGKEDLFFEETPEDRFEELGGLHQEIALLKRLLRFRLAHPELAARYRLPTKHGILLEGPPGNGKTKLARCLAHHIAELTPSGRCRFMAVAGSSDYSMWLGQSEQRLIARFDAARELAKTEGTPVVLFFDEIDAIGRRRGTDQGSSAPDRILATFLAQLDGVRQIANLIVIGATNRADVLDNGLVRPGRLGDLRLRIPAPNRQAARAILTRYLGGLPVVGEVGLLVEVILSQLYSPRGEYAELVRVTLRDGSKVCIGGRDLVSGAMLENVARVAAEEAADREAQTGTPGITGVDLGAAVDRELRGLTGLLTAANVRSYVTRLPQNVDPVAVEVLRASDSAPYVRSV